MNMTLFLSFLGATLVYLLCRSLGLFTDFITAATTREFEDMDTFAPRQIVKKLRKLPGQEGCGISGSKTGRIVGGEPAKLGAWPWVAALGERRARGKKWFFCGATLISDRHLITAAHCVESIENKLHKLIVRVGDLNLDDKVEDGARPEDIPVTKISRHPLFGKIDEGYDIAVLQLERRVNFSDLVRPICLPHEDIFFTKKDFEGYQPFVAGWGMIQYGGKKSMQLLQIQIPLLSTEDCKGMLRAHQVDMHDDSICAYADEKDACQGDSGGPLMLPIDDRYYLLGVVSYGLECAKKDSPGVYNKVHTHLKWITDQLD